MYSIESKITSPFGLINTNALVNSDILLERERERERERRRRISRIDHARYIIHFLNFIIFSGIANLQYRRGFLRIYSPL